MDGEKRAHFTSVLASLLRRGRKDIKPHQIWTMRGGEPDKPEEQHQEEMDEAKERMGLEAAEPDRVLNPEENGADD